MRDRPKREEQSALLPVDHVPSTELRELAVSVAAEPPTSQKDTQAPANSLQSVPPPPPSTFTPSKPSTSILLSVCSFILTGEFFGFIGYNAIVGSLAIFFRKHMGMNNALATELNNAFLSIFNLTPLMGGYIADKYLGRFKTIMTFYPIYILGMLCCVVGSFPGVSSATLFLLGLFVGMPVGAGGLKPNVVVLGADQFDVSIPEQRAEKDSFFNWLYWAWNIGATLSFLFMTNLAVNGFPPYISPKYGFFTSFLVGFLSLSIAFCAFSSGRSRYRKMPAQGSALGVFCSILYEAGSHSSRGKLVLSGMFAFVPGIGVTTISYFVNDPFWHLVWALGGAGCVVYGAMVLITSGRCTKWLHMATVTNGGSHTAKEVKDVKQVMRLMPYMSFSIVFWLIYGQQSTNFMLQGCQMDLRYSTGAHPKMISSAMLAVLDAFVIIVFIPIFDRMIYPALTACGIQLTLLRKIGTGLCFAVLSMVAAGIVEQKRKQAGFVSGVVSNCAEAEEGLPMSDISVWWQTPQFLFIGIGEILASISAYDLFYSEVPETMRSVCQAINLLTVTLGYIAGGGVNSIFSVWITSDLNQGKLEWLFYVIAALALVNVCAFVKVSQGFVYHAPQSTPGQDTVSGFSPALARAVHRVVGKMKLRRRESNPLIKSKPVAL